MMETAIRPGKVPFFATDVFPYGISRSSYFNKRESDELIKYGHTFLSLQNGTMEPENAEEAAFVADLTSSEPSALYSVKLWQKYLAAVSKRGTFHGFSMSSRNYNNSFTSNISNEDMFEFAS
ncbi:DUF413 domain-containing protein [Thalassotalea sp. LPB0316]|uniref:DUF413 domain-containing protein n=1 Tax=Thalassotalea sp. LPB0316 TaxID=2769490 RepID=UPI0018663D2B|nr:DUF413 domain-containing protein [Thalassotalea sp. LPB0316]QOL25629.1 DUF413 domain-containing protein [Thalassotalea sp. LPB0316]